MTEQHHTLTERMRILAQGTKYDSCNQSAVYRTLGEILIQLKTWFNCMRVLNYRILLRKEPEGGYTVLVPSLPGCITYGDTIEEAIDMAKEAIELYIESLREHGDEIPTEEGMLEYTLAVEAHA